MKKLIVLLLTVLLTAILYAQSPQMFNYQAIIRNASGVIIQNQNTGIRIMIRDASPTGAILYQEVHSITSNNYGLVNLEIGGGTAQTGNFSSIDWANGTKFIEIDIDATGGTNYIKMGTSQLLSVPYALHSKTAENGFSGNYNDLSNKPTIPINVSQLTNDVGYLNKEVQALRLSNDTIYLTNGGFVKLPAGFDGNYNSLTNKPTNVSTFTNDAGYLKTEIDSSVTNEIQVLSIRNDTIFLTNGGFVKLPVIDGSETKVTPGTNVTITGAGTTASPYEINSTSFTHYIGELYGGGIVAAVWKVAGIEHGLIASLVDLSTGTVWSNIQTTMIGTTAQSPLDGQANTNAIITQTGHTTSAAKLCDVYTSGSFSDWYLPSNWELTQCYNSVMILNTILGAANGFQFTFYWSSTEDLSNGSYTWTQAFYNGGTYSATKNTNTYRVRAVRKF